MMSTLRRKRTFTVDEEDLLCPILQETIKDPVMALDGHTYERLPITTWYERGNRRSPVTGQTIGATILLDNIFARRILDQAKKVAPELDFLKHNAVKSNLEKCIQDKEDFINNLLQKVDRINIERDALVHVETIHLKRQIEELTKLNSQIPANYLRQIDFLQQENQRLLNQLNEFKLLQNNIG